MQQNNCQNYSDNEEILRIIEHNYNFILLVVVSDILRLISYINEDFHEYFHPALNKIYC